MSRSTISTFQLFAMFPDEESARIYLEGRIWPSGPVESVWAVLKRGIHGTFHHVSPKHLPRYVDEFTFRLNDGNVANHTTKRLASFVDGCVGKRLTYKRLIA